MGGLHLRFRGGIAIGQNIAAGILVGFCGFGAGLAGTGITEKFAKRKYPGHPGGTPVSTTALGAGAFDHRFNWLFGRGDVGAIGVIGEEGV